MMMKFLFGNFPRVEGGRMFRREILDNIELTSSTFLVNLELIMKAYGRGYRIKEIGIKLCPRLSGKSKVIRLHKILGVMLDMVKLRLLGFNVRALSDRRNDWD